MRTLGLCAELQVTFLYQVPVLVINSKTQLQINSAISLHSGPFCVSWDLYLFKLLLHCFICMWEFCQHVGLHTTYMPDTCSGQNKASDFLDLALQMVLSYCLGARYWPWSSRRAVSALNRVISPVLNVPLPMAYNLKIIFYHFWWKKLGKISENDFLRWSVCDLSFPCSLHCDVQGASLGYSSFGWFHKVVLLMKSGKLGSWLNIDIFCSWNIDLDTELERRSKCPYSSRQNWTFEN